MPTLSTYRRDGIERARDRVAGVERGRFREKFYPAHVKTTFSRSNSSGESKFGNQLQKDAAPSVFNPPQRGRQEEKSCESTDQLLAVAEVTVGKAAGKVPQTPRIDRDDPQQRDLWRVKVEQSAARRKAELIRVQKEAGDISKITVKDIQQLKQQLITEGNMPRDALSAKGKGKGGAVSSNPTTVISGEARKEIENKIAEVSAAAQTKEAATASEAALSAKLAEANRKIDDVLRREAEIRSLMDSDKEMQAGIAEKLEEVRVEKEELAAQLSEQLEAAKKEHLAYFKDLETVKAQEGMKFRQDLASASSRLNAFQREASSKHSALEEQVSSNAEAAKKAASELERKLKDLDAKLDGDASQAKEDIRATKEYFETQLSNVNSLLATMAESVKQITTLSQENASLKTQLEEQEKSNQKDRVATEFKIAMSKKFIELFATFKSNVEDRLGQLTYNNSEHRGWESTETVEKTQELVELASELKNLLYVATEDISSILIVTVLDNKLSSQKDMLDLYTYLLDVASKQLQVELGSIFRETKLCYAPASEAFTSQLADTMEIICNGSVYPVYIRYVQYLSGKDKLDPESREKLKEYIEASASNYQRAVLGFTIFQVAVDSMVDKQAALIFGNQPSEDEFKSHKVKIQEELFRMHPNDFNFFPFLDDVHSDVGAELRTPVASRAVSNLGCVFPESMMKTNVRAEGVEHHNMDSPGDEGASPLEKGESPLKPGFDEEVDLAGGAAQEADLG